MKYIKIDKISPDEIQIFGRIDEDGLMRVSCTEDNPEYQAWLAEQSTPMVSDEAKTK